MQWSTVVKHVTAIYNGSVHRATGFAPQHLHMGYESKPLPQLELEIPLHAVETPRSYLIDLQKWRANDEKAVLAGLRSYYEDMKAHYNDTKSAHTHDFYVGQWVLSKILRPTDSKALGPLYEGPAEVTAVTKSSATLVFLNSNIKAIRSITHLKPYYEAPGAPTPEDQYTGPKRGEVQDGNGNETEGSPDEVNADSLREDEEEVDGVADNGQGGRPEEASESESGNLRDDPEEQQEKHVRFDLSELPFSETRNDGEQ